MSLKALDWAFEQKVKPAAAKFVLVALADYANDRKWAYPSVETLSKKTCLDRKTIMQHLDFLCGVGLLTDTGKKVGVTQVVKVYEVNYPSSTENGTVPVSEVSSTVFSAKQYRKRYSEPSVDPLRKNSPDFEAWYEEYPNKVGRKKAEESWKKAIKVTSLEVMLEALRKQKTWERWRRGAIPDPATWLNQERWNDEEPKPFLANGNGHAPRPEHQLPEGTKPEWKPTTV